MSETDAEFVDRLVGRVKGGDIGYVLVVSSREEQTRLLSLARRGAESADTITALRAEVERLRIEVQTWQGHAKAAIWSDGEECKMLTADNERLRAALHEAADELDAYYRVEYPGDHPYSKRKLAEAVRQNPARIAITQENTNAES